MGGGGGGGGTTFLAPSVDGALHSCSLRPRDVDSLGTVVCGDDVELDELAIAEGRHSMLAIAVLDIIPVGEDIVTLVGQRDETVSLLHMKPLDVANCWGGGSSRHAGGLCRVEKGQDGDDRMQGNCADAKVVVCREFGWRRRELKRTRVGVFGVFWFVLGCIGVFLVCFWRVLVCVFGVF